MFHAGSLQIVLTVTAVLPQVLQGTRCGRSWGFWCLSLPDALLSELSLPSFLQVLAFVSVAHTYFAALVICLAIQLLKT